MLKYPGMKKAQISDFWFYKFRYQITYGILFAAYIAIILYTIFVAPTGLTQNEISSATKSASLNLSNIFSSQILDFPFHILQKVSISALGLSNFGIKLPTILISIATVFAIIRLAHSWFERGTATLATIIAIASSQFFFFAQNGTPEILYTFYPIILILAGSDFLKTRSNKSLIIASLTLALSLYTPLSIYVVLALALTVLAHPHLRFILMRELSRKRKTVVGTIFAVAVLPLALAFFKDFSILKSIFGVPGSLNILENFNLLISNLFSFSSKNTGGVISPIITPPIIILIVIGLYFTFSAKHTPKSYLVNIWSIILLMVCLINPNLTTILFTPILLLTVTGLQSLIQTWYTIFPNNPYARVSGLIPISIFVIGLLITSLNNFRLNYLYSPEIVANFNQDLKLLLENTDKNRNLLVSQTEKPFFKILEKQKSAKILSEIQGQEIVLSKAMFDKIEIPKNYQITKIIVSSTATDSDRFYILKKK